jgi:hypothetical protein
LTAYAMAEDSKKCIASGCTTYLSKPINREVFLHTVSRYLGNAQTIGAEPSAASVSGTSPENGAKIRSGLIHYPGMKEIIVEFVDGLPEEVRKMIACLESNDLAALKRIVHQLRGASGGYGFDQITEPATVVEEEIKSSKNLEIIRRDVETLIALIRNIEGFEGSNSISMALN